MFSINVSARVSRLRPVQAEGLHGPAGRLVYREGDHRQRRRRHHQEDLRQPVTGSLVFSFKPRTESDKKSSCETRLPRNQLLTDILYISQTFPKMYQRMGFHTFYSSLSFSYLHHYQKYLIYVKSHITSNDFRGNECYGCFFCCGFIILLNKHQSCYVSDAYAVLVIFLSVQLSQF